MNERVHIRGAQIMHFIPSGSWQRHVGIHCAGGHSKFQGNEKIEFAFWCRVTPLDFFRSVICICIKNRILNTEQMFKEIFVSFTACTQQVGPPQEKHPWEIKRIIGIFYGKFYVAFFEFVNRVRDDFLVRGKAFLESLSTNIYGIHIELWVGRKPSQPGGLYIKIGHVLTSI